jgi:BTB/POZ domain-containing protein KCTD9
VIRFFEYLPKVRPFVHWLEESRLLGIVESLSILAGIIVFLLNIPTQIEQSHYQAWLVITSAQGQGGSGGRIQALEALNKDKVDLSGLTISNAYLERVNLQKAKLYKANFQGAYLEKANFAGAGLERADFSGACLENTDFRGAYLARVNFQGADLQFADLRGAYIDETNFQDTFLHRTDVRDTSISGVQNLTEEQQKQIEEMRTIQEETNKQAITHGGSGGGSVHIPTDACDKVTGG